MNKETREKLKMFAQNNNWQLPHPLDMERFWEFVIEAYKNGDTGLDSEQLNEVISEDYSLNEKELLKWTIKYVNGIELLRTYNK